MGCENVNHPLQASVLLCVRHELCLLLLIAVFASMQPAAPLTHRAFALPSHMSILQGGAYSSTGSHRSWSRRATSFCCLRRRSATAPSDPCVSPSRDALKVFACTVMYGQRRG